MSTNKPNKLKEVIWFNGCGGRIGVKIQDRILRPILASMLMLT